MNTNLISLQSNSQMYSKSNTLFSKPSTSHKTEKNDIWLGHIVCKNYKIISLINEGSYGRIYKAQHQVKQDFYAVKIVVRQAKNKICETMMLESQVLYSLKGETGFPRLFYYIQDAATSYLVQSLLGNSIKCHIFIGQNLYDLLHFMRFNLKTVLLFLEQAISRLEFLHKNNVSFQFSYFQYIHRDIKPENFMIGLPPKQDLIYLIDFGFACKFTDSEGNPLPRVTNQLMIGTPRQLSDYNNNQVRFAPICAHQNLTQNRASDLESLGYLAIYFYNGDLPWMKISAKSKEEKIHKIGQKKMTTSVQELCFNLPGPFEQYFTYVHNLTFDAKPNYQYLRGLIKKISQEKGYQSDCQFEWMEKEYLEESKINKVKSIISQFTKKKDNVTIEEINSQEEDFQKNHSKSGFEFKNERSRQFLEVGKKSMTADVNGTQTQQIIVNQKNLTEDLCKLVQIAELDDDEFNISDEEEFKNSSLYEEINRLNKCSIQTLIRKK